MNCIIVDDDLFSTKIMTTFIERTSSLELFNHYNNAIDAINAISNNDNKIDIIFLDIEMPEMSGIEFIKSINTSQTEVIIYSSQEKYALESYEYNVCDYLLKPVTYARFLKAINKAEIELNKQRVAINKNVKDEVIDDTDDSFVYIKDTSGVTVKLILKEILYIEAMENYVSIYTINKRYTSHSTLTKIVELVSDKFVVRVHRSFAVGYHYLKHFSNTSLTIEGSSTEIPIGRAYRDNIKRIFD